MGAHKEAPRDILGQHIQNLEAVRITAEKLRARGVRPDGFAGLLREINAHIAESKQAAFEVDVRMRAEVKPAGQPPGIPEPRSEAEKALVGRPMTEEERKDFGAKMLANHEATINPANRPGDRGPRGKRGKAGPPGPPGMKGEPGADHSAEIHAIRNWGGFVKDRVKSLERANVVQTELLAHQSNRLSEAFAQIRDLGEKVKALLGDHGPVVFSNLPAPKEGEPMPAPPAPADSGLREIDPRPSMRIDE